MKDRKYKYLEDVIEDYLRLSDERQDISSQVNKAQEKFDSFVAEHDGEFQEDDAQYAFKIHSQLKKYEENRKDLELEYEEVETLLKDFLMGLNGGKVSFEKKDDNKTKINFVLWVEGEDLKLNRH